MIKKLDKKEGQTIQMNEFIDKVNDVIGWIDDHEANSVPRFKSELLNLLKDEDIYNAIVCAAHVGLLGGDEEIAKINAKELAEKELEKAIVQILSVVNWKQFLGEDILPLRDTLKQSYEKWKEEK